MRFILLLIHCRSISDYKFVIITAVVNLLDYLTTLLPIIIKHTKYVLLDEIEIDWKRQTFPKIKVCKFNQILMSANLF